MDLVAAADVFMYVGALGRVFSMVSDALSQGGLFAFTVESLDAGESFRLRDTRRYAHAEAYVRKALQDAGLSILSWRQDTIRMDRGEPVAGLIVVAVR